MSQEGSIYKVGGDVELGGDSGGGIGSENMEHEASTGHDVGEKVVLPVGVNDSPSRLSVYHFEKLMEDYPCISKYNPVMATKDQRAHRPPPGKVALYMTYFTLSNLRLPLTSFFLKVLAYYMVGIGQMHPVSVGKILFFEMIMTALGFKPSLYMFRRFFRLSSTGDWFMVTLREAGLSLITNPPSSLKFWRFDYFFVDATLVPSDMSSILEWRDTSNRKQTARLNRKVNMLPDEGVINRKHYERIRQVSIPYRSYTGHEGVLVLAKISQDWEGDTMPVIIKKSTKKPMSLLDSLGFDLDTFDIVQGYLDADGGGTSLVALPCSPPSNGGTLGDIVFTPDDDVDVNVTTQQRQTEEESERIVAHLINSGTSSQVIAPLPQDRTPPLHQAILPSDLMPPLHHQDTLPSDVGTKRAGEDLEPPPLKLPRVASPIQTLGFAQYSTAPSSAGTSTSTHPGFEYMVHRLGPIIRGYSCTDSPALRLRSLDPSHYDDMRQLAAHKTGRNTGVPFSSFMSQRAGSTTLPSPASELLHSLGSEFYVPPPTLRLRDDGRDPTLARRFAESIIPPLRYAEGSFLDTAQLVEAHDLDALNCFISGTLMKQSCLRKLEVCKREADELHEDIAKEKAAGGQMRVEIEELKAKLIERDDQLAAKDNQLKEKDAQLELFQRAIDGVKAELADAKGQFSIRVEELERENARNISLRKEVIEKFPALFKLLLDHGDVGGVLKEFNEAAYEAGKFAALVDIVSKFPSLPKDAFPSLPPGTVCRDRLVRADTAFREKAFPILQTIASHCGSSMDDILALFEPPASAV